MKVNIEYETKTSADADEFIKKQERVCFEPTTKISNVC